MNKYFSALLIGAVVGLGIQVNVALAQSMGSGTASGSNTGDVTLGAYGSSPNANGASLSGQQLTLQPASGTQPGGVTTSAQMFAGSKTFLSQLEDQSGLDVSGVVDAGSFNAPTSTSGGYSLSLVPVVYDDGTYTFLHNAISSHPLRLSGNQTVFLDSNGILTAFTGALGLQNGNVSIASTGATTISNTLHITGVTTLDSASTVKGGQIGVVTDFQSATTSNTFALEAGCDAGVTGSMSVTFHTAFSGAPVCTCSDVNSTLSGCGLNALPTSAGATFKGTLTDILCWQCVGLK